MYSWVVNKTKYDRALAMAKGGDEEAVKQAYISLGGLVANTEKTFVGDTLTNIDVPPIEDLGTLEVQIEEPTVVKKRGRPAKNAKSTS